MFSVFNGLVPFFSLIYCVFSGSVGQAAPGIVSLLKESSRGPGMKKRRKERSLFFFLLGRMKDEFADFDLEPKMQATIALFLFAAAGQPAAIVRRAAKTNSWPTASWGRSLAFVSSQWQVLLINEQYWSCFADCQMNFFFPTLYLLSKWRESYTVVCCWWSSWGLNFYLKRKKKTIQNQSLPDWKERSSTYYLL